jgi:hypothetical protein
MKTKTIDLYEFDELPEDIKEKVLDNNRWINVDDSYWYDYDGKTGFSAEEIERYGLELERSTDLLTYKKLYFSIDRSWYIQFVDAEFSHDETARKYLGVPGELWDKVDWAINDQPSRDGNTRLEYDPYTIDGEDFTAEEEAILEQAVERFSDKIEEALRGLQKEYEYQTSDEAIIETIKANEYTFRADGKMENA